MSQGTIQTRQVSAERRDVLVLSMVTSEERRIQLPREVWKALGLKEGDRFRITLEENCVILTPLSSSEPTDWQRWQGRLAGTNALQKHIDEHADEVSRERVP